MEKVRSFEVNYNLKSIQEDGEDRRAYITISVVEL